MSTRVPLRPEIVAHEELQRKLKLSTAEIGLQLRTTNCLEEQGIFTVRDLLQSSRERLLSISNFGEKTLNEVYDALERIGFYRKSRQASAPNKVKA
ncbi:MAG: DNA-directed RNA polymerase subunit alpha [Thermoguttaceae bacterium]|nr:DNA-directed RNA polymerase subunit alpha [Thermoguttaceae bacterium]MBQ6616616.1 DNA-directed RNA polymerase subunit alpha [Thermoguttaceae bacterium]